MSNTTKHRQVGDVIIVRTEDDEFFGRIDSLGGCEKCVICYVDDEHDEDCREWDNVQVLDEDQQPTGRWAYHTCSKQVISDLKTITLAALNGELQQHDKQLLARIVERLEQRVHLKAA